MDKTKEKIYEIIFEADTAGGKLFDVALLFIIIVSVALVLLESVPAIRNSHYQLLHILEWCITIIFSIEYFLRVAIVKKPLRYIFSFYWHYRPAVGFTHLHRTCGGWITQFGGNPNSPLAPCFPYFKTYTIHRGRPFAGKSAMEQPRKNKCFYLFCKHAGNHHRNGNVPR